jgi:hypothetical protein
MARIPGGEPDELYIKSRTELEPGVYMQLLKIQFKLRDRLHIIDKEISENQIGYDMQHIPIIFPSDTSKSYTVEGGDEGVHIRADGFIVVKSLDRAFESGKWMFIINYYQTMRLLETDLPIEGEKLVEGEVCWKIF